MTTLTLLSLSLSSSPALAQDITATGTCPGLVDLDVTNATPSGTIALLTGDGPGATVVPGGPCAGAILDLAGNVQLRANLPTDAAGSTSLSPNLPAGICGSYVAILDLTTCTSSPAVPLSGAACPDGDADGTCDADDLCDGFVDLDTDGDGVVDDCCISLDLDGIDDQATVGDTAAMGVGDSLTVEAWIRPDSLSGTPRIVEKWGDGGTSDDEFSLDIWSGNLRMVVSTTSSAQAIAQVNAASVLTIGQWHHVAGVVEPSGDVSLWVDGVLVDQVAAFAAGFSVNDTAEPIAIGGPYASLPWHFDGVMGPVRVSDSVRYTSSFVPAFRFDSDAATVAAWNLTEGVGTTATDASPNGHHATISGAAWAATCPQVP